MSLLDFGERSTIRGHQMNVYKVVTRAIGYGSTSYIIAEDIVAAATRAQVKDSSISIESIELLGRVNQ